MKIAALLIGSAVAKVSSRPGKDIAVEWYCDRGLWPSWKECTRLMDVPTTEVIASGNLLYEDRCWKSLEENHSSYVAVLR